MTIGEKILELRTKNKMTQKDLADRLNISDKIISRWETGKSLPDVQMMKKISEVLNVSISDLYECVDENTKIIFDDSEFSKFIKFQKQNFISYSLLIFSVILSIVLNAIFNRGWYSDVRIVVEYLLKIALWTSLTIGVFVEIFAYASFLSYLNIRQNKVTYKKTLLIYGIVFLIILISALTILIL